MYLPSIFSKLNSNQVLHTAIKYFPSVIIPAISNLVLVAIFSRLLGPSGMGEYYLIFSTVMLGSVLTGNWLQQSILRFESGTVLANQRTMHVFIFLIATTCSIIFLSGLVVINSFYRLSISTHWIVLFLIVAEVWYRLLLSIMQAQTMLRWYSFSAGMLAVGRVTIALFFFYFGVTNAASLFLGWTVTQMSLCVVLFIRFGYVGIFYDWTRKKLPIDYRQHYLRFREYVAYGIPMMGFMILSEVRPFTDRLILLHLLSASAIGIHGSNYALGASSIGLLSMPLMLAAHPHLMSLTNRADFNTRKFRRQTADLSSVFLHFSSLLVLIVVPNSKLISKLLIGDVFSAGHFIISLATMGSVFNGLAIYLGKGLEADKDTRTMFWCNLIGYVTSIAVTVPCIMKFGYTGAAVGYAAGGAIYAGIIWRSTQESLRPFFPIEAFVIFGVSFMASLAVSVSSTSPFVNILMSAVAITIFAATLLGIKLKRKNAVAGV